MSKRGAAEKFHRKQREMRAELEGFSQERIRELLRENGLIHIPNSEKKASIVKLHIECGLTGRKRRIGALRKARYYK